MSGASRAVPRALGVLGAAYLTAGSFSLAPHAGDATVLVVLVAVVAAAWVGVAGVARDRSRVGAAALLVVGGVGALHPLLWDFLLPAAAALFVAVVLVAARGA